MEGSYISVTVTHAQMGLIESRGRNVKGRRNVMELYLLRHGIAVEPTVGAKDRQRPLTSKGRKKVALIATRLHDLGVKFDAILSSPFLRAKQTAEIVALEMKYKGEVQLTGKLMPGGRSGPLVKELAEQFGESKAVLLVGHEPDLSNLASYLLTGQIGLDLELKKGGLCKLEAPVLAPEHPARLLWLVPPKLWEA